VNHEVTIAAIEGMVLRERRTEWQRRFSASPPPAMGSGLLARALAYEVQAKAMGRLSKSELRRIARIHKDEQARGGPQCRDADQLRPGTWLSRTWHGDTHQVTVMENAFEYRGERYASLTAIAQRITGAGWSGPRFFGLKSPRLGKLEAREHGR
jgi:hypothetical protein